ncbi:hypothetical protein KAH81_04055 [bacterium]|nr:hypothetical protein [bacterium]
MVKPMKKQGLSPKFLWGIGIFLALFGVLFGYFLWDIESPNIGGLTFALVALTGLPLAMAVFNSKRDGVFLFLFLWITAYFFSRFIFGGGMLFGTDTMGLGYFSHSFYRAHFAQFGSYPLWENLLHGGMPFHAGMHGDVLYPTRILELILPIHYALGLKLVLHVWLAGFFMFGFLRSLGFCKGASFFGGLAYMFGPYFVSYIYAGHDGKMFVIMLLPLAFWALELALRDGKLWRYLLFGLTYSLMVISAHMQMAYFASWAIGAYFVFRIIRLLLKEKTIKNASKHVSIFILAVLFALLITTLQIYPPFKYLGEYSQRTQRTEVSGYEWSTSWALHPEEMGGLFFPEFAGINVENTNTYWGHNAFKLNSDYFGIIIFLLAIGAVIFIRKPRTWFFFGLGIFATIFALGPTTPFFRLFYAFIPQVKKFRGPSMILFIAVFSAVVLASEMLFALRDDEKRKSLLKRGLMVYLILIGILLPLTALIMTGAGKGMMKLYTTIFYSGIDSSKQAIMQANIGNIARGMWLGTIVVILGLGAYALAMKNRISAFLALIILSLVTLFDLWRIDKPFVKIVDPESYFGETSSISFLKNEYEKKPFRVIVFPGAFQDSHLALHGLEEVVFGVGHGNQLRTFDEFINRNGGSRDLFSKAGLTLLNADYLAVRGREIQQFPLAFQEGNLRLYRNPMSFPRAFAVYDWKSASSPEEARRLVFSNETNPAVTAAIEGTTGFTQSAVNESLLVPAPAQVQYTRPERVEVEVDMKNDGLLILCDNWYPEWHAYEGDQELEILRANGTFRAVPLSKGKHSIDFRFEGRLFKKSLVVSILAILAWGLLFILSFVANRKSRRAVNESS